MGDIHRKINIFSGYYAENIPFILRTYFGEPEVEALLGDYSMVYVDYA